MSEGFEFRSSRDPEVIPEEWLFERMRNTRDRLLYESDWTQLLDAPVDQVAWAAYRQELRDAPGSWASAESWIPPVVPGSVDRGDYGAAGQAAGGPP